MKVSAYVDGSFNARTQVYGAGIVLVCDDGRDPITLQRVGNSAVFASSRNVAGEVLAACTALQICKEVGNVEELTIYYDYAGIECWARGTWKATSPIARTYLAYVQEFGKPLSFRKVKAHTGDYYNEQADRLAKKACGLG